MANTSPHTSAQRAHQDTPGARISRRSFLASLAATATAVSFAGAAHGARNKEDIGLALGGGGARGLAHVLIFEAFDELGIKPKAIAGTSIGAIMGALYASGLSARDVRQLIADWTRSEGNKWSQAMVSLNIFKWIDLVDPALGKGGLVNMEKFLGFLHQAVGQIQFDALKIPLRVVATDFWKGEQRVFSQGEVLPAVKASMALPGIFEPVTIGGRVYVDGGTVNPLPYDLLHGQVGTTVAVDVSGTYSDRPGVVPSFFDSVLRSFHIMEQSILDNNLRIRRPDIYLKPDIRDIKSLEFLRSEEIYRQAAPTKETLKLKLARLMT